MTFDEIKQRWFSAKSGILEESHLRLVRKDKNELWYECPCGADDHCAHRMLTSDGLSLVLSPVLTCFFTRQQWLVRPIDVAAIIRREEERYLRLLELAPAIVRKVTQERGWSPETKAFLMDTHGIDGELAEQIIGERT